MKIYVLLRNVDYEGSDVLAVYRDKAVADAWKNWCEAYNYELRSSIGDRGGIWEREWKERFPVYPGDWYNIKEYDTQSEMPSNTEITGPAKEHADGK
jgi:hypothetical protein